MRTIRPLLKTTTGRPQTLESHQLSAIAEHVHVWHTLHVLCLTKIDLISVGRGDDHYARRTAVVRAHRILVNRIAENHILFAIC